MGNCNRNASINILFTLDSALAVRKPKLRKYLIGNHNNNAFIPMSKLSWEELPPRVTKLDIPEAAGIYSFAAQGPEMSRAAEDFFPMPELLSVSVPAAPNISYQWPFPNIDRPIPDEYTDCVRCIITAGPNAIARIRMNIISTQHTAPCSQSFQGGMYILLL